MTAKVQADLPALRAEGGEDATGAARMAGVLRTLGLARGPRGDPEDDEERAPKAPKTIVEAYTETYRILLRFCNVSKPGSVAPVWLRLANCHKKEQHTVLTQELQKVCISRGLSTDFTLRSSRLPSSGW